jgi:hypothetical protein
MYIYLTLTKYTRILDLNVSTDTQMLRVTILGAY